MRPRFIDWNANSRICPSCRENGAQPLDNFHRDKSRPNGRANWCKVCTHRKAAQPSNSTLTVKDAIRRPRTREEIAKITGYDEDVIADVLASLWDTGQAVIDRESRKFLAA
jgi:hypothetical protein